MKADISKKKKATESTRAKPKKPVDVPAILLEGDTSTPPGGSGPGTRYATPERAEPARPAPAELPEAYGTRKLLIAARDPHWIYAHWDLSREQLRDYNAKSTDGHLVLRIYKSDVGAERTNEIHVHPESKNWFVNVPDAGTKYAAELGYYAKPGATWTRISVSSATITPADAVSEDTSVWFETLPANLQFQHLVQLVKAALSENIPLLEAMQQLRATGFKGLPDARAASAGEWTAEQERALAELVTIDSVRRVWMGSLEITELIRRQLQQQISSAIFSQFVIPSSWSGAVGSVTSPYGQAEREKGFWFNVNAELIVYGATQPDAEVSIGGKKIRLRPDGTFSYRFALPDGKYALPAVARSSDGTDARGADLKFSRSTDYRGDVGKHPQDARLKTPHVENVS